MLIDAIALRREVDSQTLSGVIDGFELWYRFPRGVKATITGNPFLAAALIPAMLKGEAICVSEEYRVSPLMLRGIDELQSILCCWDPRLRKVAIESGTEPAMPLNDGVASFFSGGVDGSYTFLKHEAAITHLLFVHGIDMQVDDDSVFKLALAENAAFAKSRGKRLVTIATNLRRFCHAYGVPWTVYHGTGLASIGLALGFRAVFIAASLTYAEMIPWGSHPLTDRLWSTEATQFVHDGAEAKRCDKIKAISGAEDALSILRVCWQDVSYNCGECEKCLRTRVALRLLNLHTSTLARLESCDQVRRLTIWDDNDLAMFAENLNLARQVGDQELVKTLQSCVRKYKMRKALKAIDETLLNGHLNRWRNSFRRSP